jgi:copper chaperone
METVTLRVDGMTCQGCVRSVTNVLHGVPGVCRAEVSLERAEATVEFDPARVSPAALKQAIEGAGYQAA